MIKLCKKVFPYGVIAILCTIIFHLNQQIKLEEQKNLIWSQDKFRVLQKIDDLKVQQKNVFDYLKSKGIQTHYEKFLSHEYSTSSGKIADDRIKFDIFGLLEIGDEYFSPVIQKILRDMDVRLVSFVLDAKTLKNAETKAKNETFDFNIPSIWPTEGKISSLFGMRLHPISKKNKFHEGVDITNLKSTDIIATADGEVEFSGNKSGYGKAVIVNHGNGFKTLYAHASELIVSKGDTVKKGMLIAHMGSTGYSTGTHLHYEIFFADEPVDPTMFVQ